ncbi:MAG: hypothetical protein Q9208_001048 [Pyrenodesmia sp. 3 TL-2023]
MEQLQLANVGTATPPHLRTPLATSPASTGSSKRNSHVINLVSSEEEDDVVITPKRPRHANPPTRPSISSSSGEPKAPPRQPLPSSSSSDSEPPHRRSHVHNTSSRATIKSRHRLPASASQDPAISTPREPFQKLYRVEIPLRTPAIIIPTSQSAIAQRAGFLAKLAELDGPRVNVVNEVDESTPSIEFKFVNESILGKGVSKATDEVMIGCDCRKECGSLECRCLEDSAHNKNGKKVFPYGKGKKDTRCLRPFYLESRHHIYECNANCDCNDECKNRNVQHGRRVKLEIFKTRNRGWGLRCPTTLRRGDYIDTYRGEIITVEEANSRADKRSADEGNYFMNFDKFTEPEAIPKSDFLASHPDKLAWHAKKVRDEDWRIYTKDGEEMWLNPDHEPYLYVCDGMHMGGPTRFMNHSCDPNCRLFTVSYNHSDPHIYELAFFALEEIPAGTELTFDYKDEDDRSVITHEQALEVQRRDGYMPQKCLCGTAGCRQYFFN